MQTYLRAGGKVQLSTVSACDFCRAETGSIRKFRETVRVR